ncbi:hypothetical protein F4861DRAFT_202544 [Xylaria intraflava]|nr:hypothetical protein F4861DRAFT_202544 [Xylaria intraflava]
MHGHLAHVHSSRRVPALTDKDIDHEIHLVDHDGPADTLPPRRSSVGTAQSSRTADPSSSHQPLTESDSQVPLTQHASGDRKPSDDTEPETGPSSIPRIEEPPGYAIESPNTARSSSTTREGSPHKSFNRPSINSRGSQGRLSASKEPESAIDVLYENQRGTFLCGIPLFSSAALGNLDPPPWSNFVHKPSPTNIFTAQVPDPSWQWAWPEWRINYDDQIEIDGDGWEYSFMFAKKFSWHRPKWYNSFVRRRAWIRKRIKTPISSQPTFEPPMNQAYFSVLPKKRDPSPFGAASDLERASVDRQSRISRGNSRTSRDGSRGRQEDNPYYLKVETTESLMAVLGQSRIDREKLEAIENYINNCTDDLLHLQDYMHEIMSLFVFQASRKTLLARLTQLHDDVTGGAGKGKSAATPKAENLAAAIKHADEEVRRLEYWSDIKGMTESGEAARAVDYQTGWNSGWQGLDKSGPKGIDGGQLPS